jgi:ribonuclease D
MGAFKEFLKEQQIDELSKATLTSYMQKSKARAAHHTASSAKITTSGAQAKHAKSYHSAAVKKRMKGVKKAAAKLKKLNKPAKKVSKKKGFEYSKHGVADIVSHVVKSGVKAGIKGIVNRFRK